jgi:HAD superfamily hydrolase (TIGR01509 family)
MRRELIRGFIFDFDGTIIVSEQVHMRAWSDLAHEVGLSLPDGFLEHSVGMSDYELIKILRAAWQNQLDEQAILSRKRHFYMKRVSDECHPVPGVIDTILRLKDKQHPLAIATSSSRVEVDPVLESLGIFGCFSAIVTVDDVSRPKPDPEIYHRAAQLLTLAPAECLAFEDSKAGVHSARSAGCLLVTIQTLYDEATLGKALLSVRDFRDERLLALLSSIG